MIGNMFRIIKSMYESVRSVIHLGDDVSSIIVQTVGVRQGCVLSPCLFSLFIADLPQFLKEQGGVGVCIRESFVSCLLLADDGAIVVSSKEDLQVMLNALSVYCNKCRMIVNTFKTDIVIFNRQHPMDTCHLCYAGNALKIKTEFRYLGLVFHEHRRDGSMIEHRMSQTRRLLAAWNRR